MKRTNIKATLAAAVMALLVVSVSGCINTDVSSVKTDTASTQSEVSVTDAVVEETQTPDVTEPDKKLLTHNPLTGEYGYNADAVGKRPVAVMINNIDQSLPQYGIGSADYIYEVVVEGGITRLMGVFADYTNVPDVCSIRSCRYYYPIIAYGLDAIYCHWGMDHTIAEETLNRLAIDRFNGDDSQWYEDLFFNDEERLQTYSREHTGYLKGSVLPQAIADAGYRTDLLENNKKDAFNFAEGEELVAPAGTECTYLNVIFSDSYYSTFTYDAASGKYLKQHSGDPQMDSATGEQLSFTNVFVLNTDVSMRGVGQLMDVSLEGGNGYYVSDGVAQEINWTKPAENENFVITDTQGNPITVNRGKCYFGITDNVSFE